MNRKMILAALAGCWLAAPALAREIAGADASPVPAALHVDAMHLQELRDHMGWSWKSVGYAAAIAEKTGQPLEAVADEKTSRAGWRKVAGRHGLQLKDLRREADRLAKAGRQAEKAEREQDKKIGNPDSRKPIGYGM